jgi:hypothetical protein
MRFDKLSMAKIKAGAELIAPFEISFSFLGRIVE